MVPPPLMARLPAPGPLMVRPLMSRREVSVMGNRDRAKVISSPAVALATS